MSEAKSGSFHHQSTPDFAALHPGCWLLTHRFDTRDPDEAGKTPQVVRAHRPQADAVERAVAAGEDAELGEPFGVEALRREIEDDHHVARTARVAQRRIEPAASGSPCRPDPARTGRSRSEPARPRICRRRDRPSTDGAARPATPEHRDSPFSPMGPFRCRRRVPIAGRYGARSAAAASGPSRWRSRQ